MPLGAAEKLASAINGHDIDQLLACFSPDVRSEQPAHPARAFTGRDQIATNWSMIFGMVPDIEATLLRSAVTQEVEWAEWAWNGTRADGEAFALRGTTVHGLKDGLVEWLHFYMEPLERMGEDVEVAVKKAVGR